MPRAEPLITPEELQSLLGGVPLRSNMAKRSLAAQLPTLHWGAALWLVKGIFLYAVLMSPDAAKLVDSSRYLWMRGSLEMVCLAAFWGASLHPRGQTLTWASLLVASTTLLLDAMTLLAFTG
ncbi:hypothetical protein [Limnohabitans sp. Bal53]|jgi:hypothetical protein|uniref:hypothetical protein n=1 Tax=Limnohabitans sp. Bal53 TaxID=1977910 RepID=UPI000D38D021|nr:hypothetical protein [Limnohabitans sp. Bal53]PUE42976.1 hypothetical protein B9Z50_04040 [Limnohabitans sp. Bal53]